MSVKRRLRSLLHGVKYSYMQSVANTKLKKVAELKAQSDDIKVGFIVQLPEVWDKEAPVFEAMVKDNRFDPYLIVVPGYDFAKSEIRDYGDELSFFSEHYDHKYIIKAYNNGRWLDLKSLHFDYIFFQRCWENYLPYQYHTCEVVKYAKTCYIPYGIGGMKYNRRFYEKSFFTSLYIHFCSTKEQVDMQKNSRFKHNVCLGIPVLDKKINTNVVSDNKKQVLWTPRWTEETFYGGSSFFAYMNKILELKTLHPDMKLVLRPHPLAFDNAVRLGRMTAKEVARYKEKVQESGAVFDENEIVGDTFEQTSILITDFSSIILEYFLSGRPVVYCTNINIDLSETYKYIAKGFYVVKNWEELKLQVGKLMNGTDELKDIRNALLQNLKKQHNGAVNRIIEFIVADSQFCEASKIW